MVRVGLSGAGAMGSMHARVLSRLDGCRLAGVYDVDPARARALAAEWGVPPWPRSNRCSNAATPSSWPPPRPSTPSR